MTEQQHTCPHAAEEHGAIAGLIWVRGNAKAFSSEVPLQVLQPMGRSAGRCPTLRGKGDTCRKFTAVPMLSQQIPKRATKVEAQPQSSQTIK